SLEEGDPFDVCFLDWKMPEMDGEETACKIREIVGPETLIIIISAYDWSPIEKRAREAGVNGFIAKPFFTSSFYDCLKANDVNRKNETEKQATQPAHHPTIKKRILLAEDNVFNAEVAEEFLDMAGYEVEVQTNGKKAFEAFEQRPTGYYDLIFMDIQMPEMNGLEATRKIRQLDRKDAKEIPIVAMTANAFSEDVSISLEAGMNDHISKPLELKRLYQVLGKYLGTDPKNKE
ncbi:response regulator, partial [uncultured Parasutterella sp.]